MPHLVPPVPPPRRGGDLHKAGSATEPAFPPPVRWTLRVLAWLAFGVASYLTIHALTHTRVAGCSLGSNVDCDVVQSSSWSTWLGIPVAFLGLACYATLAALSVLLGVRRAPANRWIATAFVMLAIVAAGASLWFIGIQIFAIGTFCLYCLIADICGIALGVIATMFAVRAVVAQPSVPQRPTMQHGLMALRTAMPTANRSAPLMVRAEPSSPLLIPAIGCAIAVTGLFIGAQILFADKSYDEQKVALNTSIAMDGNKTDKTDEPSSTAKTRVAMRLPTDGEAATSDPATKDNSTDGRGRHSASSASAADQKGTVGSQAAAAPEQPARTRLVKLLSGKLTVDVYRHPILGSPEAPHIAVELVSYDCPHCRKMYPIMDHALQRYGDQVALVVMVVPMAKECNKLVPDTAVSNPAACTIAKSAIGIAQLNPSAFARFHDFLMSSKDKPPPMEAILPKAYVLADRNRLRKLIQGDELDKQIAQNVDLLTTLQKQSKSKKEIGLPVQILGDFVISGSVEKEEDVFKAWEEHLGVKPR
jgi:uncharacterized membrane protein/protein-disulfide isomerase